MAQNLVADISAILSQIEETHNPIDLQITNLSQKLNINLSWHPGKELTSYSLSTNTYAEKAVKNSMNQRRAKKNRRKNKQTYEDFIAIFELMPPSLPQARNAGPRRQ